MSSYGFPTHVMRFRMNGPALTGSTTQTNILPTAKRIVAWPIGFFGRPEECFDFLFYGRISTVTTPGTLQMAIRMGSVDAFLTGQMPLNAVAKTDVHWTLRGTLMCDDIGDGTSTTLFPVDCSFRSHAVIGSPAPSAGGAGEILLPYNAAPAAGAGFDNGTSQMLSVMAQWSASNGNSIQMHGGWVQVPV